MQKSSFRANPKASLSLASMLRRQTKKLVPSVAMRGAGFHGAEEVVRKEDLVSLLVEKEGSGGFEEALPAIGARESIEHLGGNVYSARVSLESAEKLLRRDEVQRVQTKKKSVPHLDSATIDLGAFATPSGPRAVPETGDGVLIGVVDSGFDLSHPMFRDDAGKLRVKALLDQTTGRELTTTQLETEWASTGNPLAPGGDPNGHGTHVATIAGGSRFNGIEGVAPDAQFLLVKTNFLDTADAVAWIFKKATNKPCVVNMSLGHHWGAHDGTDVEEKLHESLVGRGRIIVISAGNERSDPIHLGGRFMTGATETVGFRVLRQAAPDQTFAVITLWYDAGDDFTIDLLPPTGSPLTVPSIGNVDHYAGSQVELELGCATHDGPSPAVKVEISISSQHANPPNKLLTNWGLRIRCNKASVGRLDAWFNNSGYGEFRQHALIEQARTIGLSATGRACLCVASHQTKSAWTADDGNESDPGVVIGRTSPFSSLGPTRDDRQKPDLSAPGQYVTAGLADQCELARMRERALSPQRLLTIEGTSMAAPVVTGAVALLLQKKRTLTADAIRDLLTGTARGDVHTGTPWNPAYGHGKIDIVKALSKA